MASFSATRTATARQTAPIRLSNVRTPASRVYFDTRKCGQLMCNLVGHNSTINLVCASTKIHVDYIAYITSTDNARQLPINLMESSGICSCFGVSACSISCLGTRWRTAIAIFSSCVYPGTSMISIRSRSAAGIVASEFAVAIKSTCDKSNGVFK